jgi:phytol kinase
VNLLIALPYGEFLSGILPGFDTIRIVGPVAIVYAWLAFRLTSRLKVIHDVRTAYTRKTFHFLTFTMASVVQMAWGVPGVVVFGVVVSCFVCYALLRGDGHPWYEALARPSDAPHRTLFIFVPLVTTAVGGLISNLLFARFAYVGYLVCGWGDAVGEPVGTRWGRHRYRVPSLVGVKATRSLEGSAAVALFGAVAASAGLFVVGYDLPHALAIGLACGIGGALVEAVSTHGLDNLTTQVAASAIAYFIG